MQKKSIALVGAGSWGLKILKTLKEANLAAIKYIVQRNKSQHAFLQTQFPDTQIITSLDQISKSSKIDLVILSTPTSSHYDLLKQTASLNFNCLVEKPFCSNLSEAKEIFEIFRNKKLKLFVDHIYLYSPQFNFFAAQFKKYFLGKQFLYTSRRWDFGSFPGDCDTVSHLIYHDLVILDHLLGLESLSVHSYWSPHKTQAVVELTSPQNALFELSASQTYLDKIRWISVSNEEYCIEWNDLSLSDPFRFAAIDPLSKSKEKIDLEGQSELRFSPSALFNLLQRILDWDNSYDTVLQAIKVKTFIERVQRNGS